MLIPEGLDGSVMSLPWVLHLADIPFRVYCGEGEVKGVSPAWRDRDARELGRRRGTSKVIRLCGKYLKRQIWLACEGNTQLEK